jgi:hypothetical protein
MPGVSIGSKILKCEPKKAETKGVLTSRTPSERSGETAIFRAGGTTSKGIRVGERKNQAGTIEADVW